MKLRNMRFKYGTHFMAEGEASWRDGLPEDIKDDKGLADFADLGGMAKAYLDTKADVGRSVRIPGPDADVETLNAFHNSLIDKVPALTRIPGDDSTDEQRDAFYRQLGRPAEASGYTIPEAKDELAKAGLLELAADSHKQNLTQDQFSKLANTMLENHTKQIEAMSTAQRDDFDKLKIDWGSGLEGKTHAIVELAKATKAPQAMIDAITGRTIGSATMKWMDSMVQAMSGDGPQMTFQGAGNADDRISPAEANSQVEELMNRPEYWDASSPQQAGLVEKVVKLQKIAIS